MARARYSLAALCISAACSFEPVVRGASPERVGDADVELVRTLDRAGTAVLVRAAAAQHGPEPTLSVLHWHRGTRCAVPDGAPHMLDALDAPGDGRRGAQPFVLPMLAEGEPDTDAALTAVDERCRSLGELGALRRDSVQTHTSPRDARGLLFGRDGKGDLYVLDPFRRRGLQTLAANVTDYWPWARSDGDEAVWVLSGGQLALIDLSGRVERVIGAEVSEFALDPRSGRVGYVDAGVLRVADPPSYLGRDLAQDACAPKFVAQALYALSPCDRARLLALYPSAKSAVRYPEGVVAALRRGPVEVVYSQRDGVTSMTVNRAGAATRALDPALSPSRSFLLADGSVAGLTGDGRFGVHAASGAPFRTLFERVADLRAAYRGKSRSYWFVAYHHVEDGLGTLSGLGSTDFAAWEFAEGVPAARAGGFVLDSGQAFPGDPFPEPVLVTLGDARPSDGGGTGTLRAALVSGEPAAELGEGVSGYLLVASPLPGLLYRVPGGARQGLWYAPL